MRVDAHQHFWRYEPREHAWSGGGMQALQRDFLPRDLRPLLDREGIDLSIAVEARPSESETQSCSGSRVTTRGSGESRTKQGSSYLIMSIVCGAVVPYFMGLIGDRYGTASGYWIPVICFAVVAAYGVRLLRSPG